MSETLDIFGEFAPAYTISNENQRWATSAVPGVSKVLTVAGSGDQALFYHLNGATHIDTFDKTRNARVIQDIKFIAAKNISWQEYSNLLIDLFYTQDITKIPTMQKLLPMLPKQSIQIINKPGNKHIFGAGLEVRHYPENIPSPEEYAKLQKTLKKPFKFICCDLYDLSAKISGTYDLINLSNIFDYCYDGQTQAKILSELTDHINIGGHIAYLPQAQHFEYNRLRITSPKNAELVYEHKKTNPNISTKMILFQRVR